MGARLMDKRAVEDWVVKRKQLFQMRPGQSKPTRKHQTCARDAVTENESAGIVALIAQPQQILAQAPRHIEFAADHVIDRLPIDNLQQLRGRTQFLPQLSRPSKDIACFRRRVALDESQQRAQGTAKFELLSLASRGVWEQRQLVQPLLKLCRRFRHRRAGGGSLAGLAPVRDRFFNDPSVRVMLREQLGLVFYDLQG